MPVFISTTQCKNYLRIPSTNTTYDSAIEEFIPYVLEDIVGITNNEFKEPYRRVYDDGFVFSSSDNSITLDGNTTWAWNDFFKAADTVIIQNSRWNDNYYSVNSSSSSVLIVNEDIVSENSTDFEDTAYIWRCEFPDYVKKIGARMVWFSINNSTAMNTDIQSQSLGNHSYSLNVASGSGSFSGYPSGMIKGLKKVAGIR